ncbi:MAG: DNA translocase FtsK [Spirochaetales bacterium]
MAVYTNINRNRKKQTNAPINSFPLRKLGYVMMGVAIIAYIALFTNFLGFLRYFLMGTFGVFSYAIFSGLFVVSRAFILGKTYSFDKKVLTYFGVALVCILAVLQLAFLGAGTATSFGEYLSDVYHLQTSVGGVIIALITYPLLALLNSVGVYVLFIIIMGIMTALLIDYFIAHKTFRNVSFKGLTNYNELKTNKEEGFELVTSRERERLKNNKPININLSSNPTKEPSLKMYENEFDANSAKTAEQGYFNDAQIKPMFSAPQSKATTQTSGGIKPPKIVHSDYTNIAINNNTKKEPVQDDKYKRNLEFLRATIPASARTTNNIKGVGTENPNSQYSTNYLNTKISERMKKEVLPDVDAKFEEELKQITKVTAPSDFNFGNNIVNNEPKPQLFEEKPPIIEPKPIVREEKAPKNLISNFKQMQLEETEVKEVVPSKASRLKRPSRYIRPPMDLLSTISTDLEDYDDEYLEKSKLLERVLDDFRVPAKVIAVTKGPAVTRYELQMPAGISVKKILQHAEDIAMTLESNGAVRIEAPIPGKNAVGVEVPNKKIATIGLKDVINTRDFAKSKSHLTFGLGKDISGTVQICDLSRMPHLLVAGATGSGKSVCLNSLIVSLLYKSSPEDLRLILIDPKRVEFYVYNGLPHLMLPNVITETDKALNAFNYAIEEMERRFSLFQREKVKNLAEYNNQPEVLSGEKPKIPMLVIIVDELADLIMTAKRDVEDKIMRLAQKARAAGIHLVLATQRPSVDVITGTIKANLPSRIAFGVTSIADSKTVLDGGGAEKLLGKGDMLFAPIDYPEPRRIQGAFVSNEEVKAIVDFIKNNNDSYFDEKAEELINKKQNSGTSMTSSDSSEDGFDEMMPQALRLVIETGQASISMLQRRFAIGYARAARIIDQMELAKFISPSDGSKARNVYITMREYKEMYGED